MNNFFRHLSVEVLWIFVSLVLSILLAFYLFGNSVTDGELDLHLYDTYLIISRWLILLPLLLLVTFIVFFIRVLKRRFSSPFANWILLICGVSLQVALTILSNNLSQLAIVGWTEYPPLSNLPKEVSEVGENTVIIFLLKFVNVVEVVTMIMIIFAAFSWGARKGRADGGQLS